jgi:hypothetical protein
MLRPQQSYERNLLRNAYHRHPVTGMASNREESMTEKLFPKWIYRDGEILRLGFDTVEQAAAFIRAQSPNTGWRAKWLFREIEGGGAFAEATTTVKIDL